MKKFFLCLGWFVVLFIGILMIGGAIVGGMAGAGAETMEEGARLGEQAGEAFGEKYGVLIMCISFSVAVVGTLTGILPFTKESG